jgi:hypothetical protein
MIDGVWPAVNQIAAGNLVGEEMLSLGNIKVVYSAGFTRIPWDLQDAVIEFVKYKRARSASGMGGDVQSESLDYYSYTRMSAEEAAEQIGGLSHTLKRYGNREEVW